MWQGQEETVSTALQYYLVLCLPVVMLCSSANLQESTSCPDLPSSPVLSGETANPKEQLCAAYTPLCSETSTSLSFRVLLLALAETQPPFGLHFPIASCVLTHICLASLSYIFPFLIFKSWFLLIFLSLFFAMCVKICICWSMSFSFTSIWLSLGLSLTKLSSPFSHLLFHLLLLFSATFMLSSWKFFPLYFVSPGPFILPPTTFLLVCFTGNFTWISQSLL